MEDLKNYKETGEWQKSLLKSENDYDLMINMRDLSIQLERIENDDVRKEIKNLRTKLSKVMFSSKSESETIMYNLAMNDIDLIMEKIGLELRKNY